MQRLAELALAAGDRARATQLLQTALPMAHATWLQPHLVVRTHALLVESSDGPKEAVVQVRTADCELEGPACPPCSLGYHLAAAKALAHAAAPQQAQRRLDNAERLAGMWPGGAAHAAVWEARAVLREGRGDVERARAFWHEAADRYDEVDRPVDRDRCRAHAAAL